MFRIHAYARGAIASSAMFLPMIVLPAPALAMGDAHHDLARDMATTVYGVPYDGPKVPGAAPKPDRAPKGADDADARGACESAGAPPPECRTAAPRRKAP